MAGVGCDILEGHCFSQVEGLCDGWRIELVALSQGPEKRCKRVLAYMVHSPRRGYVGSIPEPCSVFRVCAHCV